MSKEKEKKQKLWITISETINTGAYSNVKVDAGYSKMYTDENPADLLDAGIDELLTIIQKKAKKIRKKNKK